MIAYRIIWIDTQGLRHATAPNWHTEEEAKTWRKLLLRDPRVRMAVIEKVIVHPAA